MKALFFGAGSIGKRHLRDFYVECKNNGILPVIHTLRRRIGNLGDEEALITKQITEVSDDDYDVVFITNPTNLHYDALRQCKGKTKWYFVEKPIFDNTFVDFSALDINNTNTYVAAPMRHTLLYKKLKEIVEAKKVFSARVICSSYLPEWRKGVDYRDVYSSNREMGGGVNLDLVHEIDYAYDLFGEPNTVLGISGHYSDLEISSNDLSTFIFEYNDKLCEIHLDYFGKKSIRTCEIYTHEGTYIADFYKEKLFLPDGKIEDYHIMPNEEFLSEMSYFFRFISGKTDSINPPSLAFKTLQIAMKGDKQYGK